MKNITLDVPENCLVEWVQQLSTEAKHTLLKALIPDLDQLEELVDYGSERMRTLCAARGLDWDALSEDQRQNLVDQILHEEN